MVLNHKRYTNKRLLEVLKWVRDAGTSKKMKKFPKISNFEVFSWEIVLTIKYTN